MEYQYYFAYGSNLHPLRLEKRIGKAEIIATGELPNAKLLFSKKGKDNSAKCTIRIDKEINKKVFGVIYKISRKQKSVLDNYESLGKGYTEEEIMVHAIDGKQYNCFTYIAMEKYIKDDLSPFDWYKELVYLGAIYNNFPKKYIKKLKDQPSVPDNDSTRASKNRRLIEKINHNIVNYQKPKNPKNKA